MNEEGITLPATLGPLADVAAKDESRYSMATVHVQDLGGAVRLEATNGKIAVIIRGPCEGQSQERDVLVPAPLWKDAFRTVQDRSKRPVRFMGRQHDWTLAGLEKTAGGKLAEGRFPAIDDVLPKTPAPVSITIDAGLLKTLLQSLIAIGLGDGANTVGATAKVTLLLWECGKPIGISGVTRDGLFVDALLMPITPEKPKKKGA